MDITGILEELRARMQKDLDFFAGSMPERYAIAWRGYLAGLLEWNVLDVASHDQLVTLLPEITEDPVIDILLGRE